MIRSILKKTPVPELAALIIAVMALAGWLPEKQGWTISTLTAVTFIICIISKLLFEYAPANKKLLLPARILALCAIGIGVLNIVAIVFKLIPVDSLFERMPEDIIGSEKNMVLISGGSFILIGIALYRLTFNNAEKIFLSHILSLFILFVTLLSVIAYFFHENIFSPEAFYKPMRMVSAICFSLIAFSILLVNRDKGFIGDLTSEYQGSKIARVLIPVAIVVPVVLGFFQLRSGGAVLYSRPSELALLTLGRIIILVLFIWRTAVIINRSNKALIEEIEEGKKNEDRLRYQKAVLEAQNEAIPDAILVVDTGGKILSFNHQFGKLWRIPKNILDERDDTEALKFAMTQLTDPNEFIHRVNYIYGHPEEPAHDEILFKDGRIIERYGNVVIGDDGRRYGWAWYFRDITLNKNYENTIKDFNRDLEIKVKERTEELNKSEMRFRLLVENSLDIISLIDYDGRIIYISPSIKRLTGFTEKEMIGLSGFDLIHPNDVEGGKKFRQKLIDMPFVPANSIFRLKHKNGGHIWVEGTVTNMLNDENVQAFVLNYHDITERKKAEESLRNSEKRFRSLIENAQDIISLSDENGIRFYVSPSIERITGFTIEETINQPVFTIVHPDDRERTKKLRNEFMKEPGVLKPISFRFLHKKGGVVWIEGTIVNLLHDENVKAIVGNFHDVTERKLSEEKIRISNERFEMVSKATNDAVWDWNLETDLIYWNEGIRSMFNYCAEDIPTGSEWKVHIYPDDFKRVTKKLVYHVKNGIQNWQDEYRFLCADGSYKFVFNRGFILFNEDGKPYRIIGAMQDVTEINKLEQSLNNERIKKQKELTNATIEGQEKERTEIGRELHDNINQLITATKLYLDVAASQPTMKDEMIKRSTDNLSKCMEEIRRLSSALVPPSIGINSFSDIIQDLIEPVRLATEINIICEVKDVNNMQLTNDQLLNVYRIIQEHLNNILKHAKANTVLLSVKHVNDRVDIRIKDDGLGFDIKTKRKGIGFKNIQSRAELLNGKMEVRSRPGAGCLLVVSFPVKQPADLIG